MRLSSLEAATSFALLGPGFGGGRWLLLRQLVDVPAPAATLVLAPFEAMWSGGAVRAVRAGAAEACDLELDRDVDLPLAIELDVRGHAAHVARIREAIARGDVYQVCLTVRARVAAASGADLLAAICRRGVPRFAAWVRLPGGGEIVSGSPELFFEIDGERVHAEPMKGTAPPDARASLDASDKDRCELAMITDLLRNDLTPICRPGSVRVENARRVLELPYALQTVSDVVGELADGVTALDVLAALHPGGSVTGAPKRAALAMIREIEPTPRGAYCGALGLLGDEGARFSLLIRTAERVSDTSWVYGVGGGIVYDSDAERELEELHLKLGALRCGTRCSA